MKIQRYLATGLMALTVSMTATSVSFAASDMHLGPTSSEASVSNPDGTWINMWGPAFISTTFDAANPPPTGDTTGSVYNQGNWTGDTGGMDDYNMISPGTWWGNVVFDGTQFTSIEMDIKYDTNSTMTPTSAAHLNIGFDKGYSFVQVTNVSFDTASSPLADGKWHHLSIAISATQSGISAADGVAYYQWNPAGTSGTMNFWMANVGLVARVVPVPPPTLAPPVKAIQGLNIFASTEGNSFYDRQEVLAVASTGLSWVNQATSANPVSYSFTLNGYPTNIPAFSGEAYLFLVPNPVSKENSPDWNETNVVVAVLKNTANGGGSMAFQYKVGEGFGQDMYTGGNAYTNPPGSWDGVTANYLESGNLTNVTSTNLLGTWTIKFTSNTNGMLIGPDGTTASFIFPPYNVNAFAESSGFNIYLGMQANSAAVINQAMVFSAFAVSNVPSAFSDNFLADVTLNTNVWNPAYAGGPAGILVVPAGNPYWVSWTLPANGFVLTDSSSLAAGAIWNNVASYKPITMHAVVNQLISTNDLGSNNAEFFRLVKRSFTQLLVLLPGETNAPNTATGKIGTPTPVSASNLEGQEIFTVMAVDGQWNPIPGSSDTITISSSDSGAALPNPAALNNGTQQFTIYLDQGTPTITATDTTNPAILSNTSSAVTVTQ